MNNFLFYVLIDKRKPITGMGWMEFAMELNSFVLKNLGSSPRSHMLNRLIFNGITDAEVLISITDKLLGFIGESGLFDKTTPEEIFLSRWRRDMVDRLMHQGLTDADQIISTANKLYEFLISRAVEDGKKTETAFYGFK
ncbi:MAG TPA: hypothetical protein H9887_03425 [Candidatus Dorea intestinavium]|nr:hypothetical protein [Candidatus Dorea intestinavium]